MGKPLIAILLPDLRGGGVERIRLVLAKEFLRQGYDVEIVLMRTLGDLLPEANASFTVVDLACARARKLPFVLHKYLRDRRPDALLVGMWPVTVIAPLMRLTGYRGRIVVSEHNTLSTQYASWGCLHHLALRASMAIGYRLAYARIGVSSGVADDIAALSGLSRNKFDVIHNPLPPRALPNQAAINAAEAYWPVPAGARILTVGSMKAQKNHAMLLRAFAQMNREDAQLMLLGTGKGEQALRAMAAELKISSRVVFAGFHPDPTPFYMTADLFVLSSDYEGFGNVILEALATGTPVVSTDCPSGPATILDNGRYGALVPVKDARALAAAIVKALATTYDSDLLRGRAADFTPEIAARAYLGKLSPDEIADLECK